MLEFEENLGTHHGYMGFGYYSSTLSYINLFVISDGYPWAYDAVDAPQGIGDGFTMYECSGSIGHSSTYVMFHELPMTSGQSGSPLWRQGAGSSGAIAFGVMQGEMTDSNDNPLDNLALRIDPSLYNLMLTFR